MNRVLLVFTCIALLSAPLIVYAQTGPGGVGTVDGTSSLLLWLRADSGAYTPDAALATSDGDTISQWRDISGNQRHATALNTSIDRRPMLGTDSNGRNGHPVVRFDGDDDYMRTDAEESSLDQPFTVFAVARRNSSGSTAETILDSRSNGSNTVTLGYWSSNQARINAGSNVTADVSQNSFNVFRGIFNGSSSSLGINGDTASNGDAGSRSADGFRIGSNRSTGQLLDGDVAEVMVFQRVLNPAEITIVENYLSARYAIAIDNDYFADSISTHGLVGIGRRSDSTHTFSRTDGLMLLDSGFASQNGDMLMAGHNGAVNDVISLESNPYGVLARWAREWYIDKTATGDTSGDIVIGFDFSQSGLSRQPRSNCACQLLYRSSTGSDYRALNATPSVSGDSVFFQLDETVIADGYYTLGTSDVRDAQLPVEIARFDATYHYGSVELHWTTASEVRNGGFILSRSRNAGEGFSPIASYLSDERLRGQGTKSTSTQYLFVDSHELESGEHYYYRLADVDVDGRISTEGHITSVQVPEESPREQVRGYALSTNTPNPANGTTAIRFVMKSADIAEITVYDPLGIRIRHYTIAADAGVNQLQIDVSDLAPGMYYYRLQSGNFVATRTMAVR